ncbi:MAG: hypothetical protein CML46_06570 [Rhodobacteraceae bacterium]|nr:hypothetical protein [Paracoccaceae bacterium]|tara:strand:+ start:4514 stop:4936 length:423 start_codon:yes stop_codon:yes gene_type:complete
MTLIWPADLPRPNRDGYQVGIEDPRLRKSAETGPPGWRRRWSSVARSVSLTVDLSRSQKAVFDQFHEEAAGYGALPFEMPDPVTDGWPLLTADGAPVLTSGGAPVLLAARWICLFGATPPVETLVRPLTFRKSFDVWVMP